MIQMMETEVGSQLFLTEENGTESATELITNHKSEESDDQSDEVFKVVGLVKEAEIEFDEQGGMIMKSIFEYGPEASFKKQTQPVFACTEDGCEKKYRSKVALEYHTAVQHTREYVCEICNQSCADKERLIAHKKRVHAKTCATGRKVNEKKSKKVYNCGICSDRRFKSESQCKEHCAVHHMGKRFQCDAEGCQKVLKSSKSFYRHRMTHTKRHACNIDDCKQKFSLRYQLERHIKGKHLGLESYICQFCMKQLSNNWSLARHLKLFCKMNSSTSNIKKMPVEDEEVNSFWTTSYSWS